MISHMLVDGKVKPSIIRAIPHQHEHASMTRNRIVPWQNSMTGAF
jgi:hypothetical protein